MLVLREIERFEAMPERHIRHRLEHGRAGPTGFVANTQCRTHRCIKQRGTILAVEHLRHTLHHQPDVLGPANHVKAGVIVAGHRMDILVEAIRTRPAALERILRALGIAATAKPSHLRDVQRRLHLDRAGGVSHAAIGIDHRIDEAVGSRILRIRLVGVRSIRADRHLAVAGSGLHAIVQRVAIRVCIIARQRRLEGHAGRHNLVLTRSGRRRIGDRPDQGCISMTTMIVGRPDRHPVRSVDRRMTVNGPRDHARRRIDHQSHRQVGGRVGQPIAVIRVLEECRRIDRRHLARVGAVLDGRRTDHLGGIVLALDRQRQRRRSAAAVAVGDTIADRHDLGLTSGKTREVRSRIKSIAAIGLQR